MDIFQPGDVVLLTFPFTDAVGQKRRPALVLIDTGDPDIVVARITSQPYSTAFDILLTHWQSADLLVPSTVRLHKVATLDKGLVNRRLGCLAADQ
ncbi:MAG: type II toxin-antitoxin system PemK/MazF family toxin [Leptolyngbyaceae cyanobacterium SM2_5_2]|nr:type II toxin-antitoxin system PemK/MazF family toxin [Leptolyngbyaceae cyanobacterium SM2_5_2]